MEATKYISIKLIREQLLYDIKQRAFVEGDTLRTEDEHARHQIIDIGECGNIDLLTRMMDRAILTCQEALYSYTRQEVEDGRQTNDILHEAEVYTLSLAVPKAFSRTTQDYLTKLIHDFVVARCLAEWFITVLPDKASLYQDEAEGIMQDINRTKHRTLGRVRRTQTPF